MSIFKDRTDAGKCLADLLKAYTHKRDAIVLALPRGGVPIAFEISTALNLPLDLFLVRKLGTPGHEELAMGAIAGKDICIFNEDVITRERISQQEIEAEIAKEKKELARRNERYRQGAPVPPVKDKTILLVDDGIATGATVKAALLALKKLKPARIVLAVPVAAEDSLALLKPLADEVICPYTPAPFYGVGAWYESFPQTTDEEVCTLLMKAQTYYEP